MASTSPEDYDREEPSVINKSNEPAPEVEPVQDPYETEPDDQSDGAE